MTGMKTLRRFAAIALVTGLAGCGGEATIETIAKWQAAGNVAKLTESFTHYDQSVRVAAIQAVAALKAPEAVAPLALLFQDPDKFVAHKAIDAVLAIGGPEAQQQAIGLLSYETPTARAAAAKALGAWKTRAAVAPLSTALDDQISVSAVAAQSLGLIGDKQAIPALAAKLKDRSYDLRQACVTSITQLGGAEAAAALAPTIGDFSESVRTTVKEAMIQIGDPAVPYVLEALRDNGEFTRPAAAAILKAMGKAPQSGTELVWFTLAKIPQDVGAPVDPALVAELAAIDGGTEGLLEAITHLGNKVYDYAYLALDSIGKPATAAAVAAANQKLTGEAKSWFESRRQWSGAPSWRLDLWGAITALNPRFTINPPKAKTLETFDADARTILSSSQFKPTPEYVPLLIKQTRTPEEFENREKKKSAQLNKPLAEKHLLNIGKEAFNPLVAALEDEDLSIAGSSAKLLLLIDKEHSYDLVVESLKAKVEGGTEVAGSELLQIVTDLNDPSIEPLLVKVRPNNARAIQVFEQKYPGVSATTVTLPPSDPHPTAEPFKLKYLKDGKSKELRVIFRKNDNGEWAPEPPLPDTLP